MHWGLLGDGPAKHLNVGFNYYLLLFGEYSGGNEQASHLVYTCSIVLSLINIFVNKVLPVSY